MTLDLINAVFAASGMPLLVDFSFRDREQSPDNELGKAVAFDIVGECADGTKVNIEVQAAPYRHMVARTLYYWSRLFSRELKQGEGYGKLAKTVCINFLDYVCPELSGLDDFHNKYELRNVSHPEHRLSDLFSMHFIEMPKWEQLRIKLADQFDPKTLSRLEKWLCYLSRRTDDKQREELVMGEPALQTAYNAEQKFFTDPSQFGAYEKSEEGLRLLRASWEYAVDEGVAMGELKAKKNTAQKMLSKGISPEEVAEMTDLTLEAVKQLASEQ